MFWYRKASDKGYAEAQCNLGYCYELGNGVPQDDILAAYWYRKAAEQGHAISQCNLGHFYLEGKGVTKSLKEARIWWGYAAAQGYESAAQALRSHPIKKASPTRKVKRH